MSNVQEPDIVLCKKLNNSSREKQKQKTRKASFLCPRVVYLNINKRWKSDCRNLNYAAPNPVYPDVSMDSETPTIMMDYESQDVCEFSQSHC